MNCHHLQMIIPNFDIEIPILYQLKLCRSRLSWWPARATCSAEVGPGDTVTTEVDQPLVYDFTNLTGGLPAILHELNNILTLGWFTLDFIGQKSGCPAEKIIEKTVFWPRTWEIEQGQCWFRQPCFQWLMFLIISPRASNSLDPLVTHRYPTQNRDSSDTPMSWFRGTHKL